MNISKIKDCFKTLAGLEDHPEKVAMSFAVGTFIGISPLLGIHTFLAIFAAWFFKLNKAATITAAYISNPLTIIPIYTFSTWVGVKLMGRHDVFPHVNFKHLKLKCLLNDLDSLLMPFVLGTTLVGVIAAVLMFIIVMYIYKIKSKMDYARVEDSPGD
ncbi:MAG: DUF2062 domain-containing protein [Nitrospirae bacterium]|nr:DUF2062 domain-containing protein [Nitrospirota bacterium]